MSEHPTFLCRCEEIDEVELLRVIDDGARTIDDVKRRCRFGMGICQGIFCLSEAARILARETGQNPADFTPFTQRPPARPIPAGMLADLLDE